MIPGATEKKTDFDTLHENKLMLELVSEFFRDAKSCMYFTN